MQGLRVEGFSSFDVSGSSGGIHSYYCMGKAGFQEDLPLASSPAASQGGHLLLGR